MAPKGGAKVSLDEILRNSREKLKQEKLAQDILGKNRRTKTPKTASSSRARPNPMFAGVSKQRTSSPHINNKNNNTSTRKERSPCDTRKERRIQPSLFDHSSEPGAEPLNNRHSESDVTISNEGPELSFKGAARGPFVVIASNFEDGTTAPDIESVMTEHGGPVVSCKILAEIPVVVAEIAFAEKSGADHVVGLFHNKKADGRTIQMYYKPSNYTTSNSTYDRPPLQLEPEPTIVVDDDTMEVDETVESRKTEDRLREERRGGARYDRGPRESFQPPRGGDRGGYQGDSYNNNNGYNRGPQRPEPGYVVDGRYGFGQGDHFSARGGAGFGIRGGGFGPRGGGFYPRGTGFGPRGGGYRNNGYAGGPMRGGQGWRP